MILDISGAFRSRRPRAGLWPFVRIRCLSHISDRLFCRVFHVKKRCLRSIFFVGRSGWEQRRTGPGGGAGVMSGRGGRRRKVGPERVRKQEAEGRPGQVWKQGAARGPGRRGAHRLERRREAVNKAGASAETRGGAGAGGSGQREQERSGAACRVRRGPPRKGGISPYRYRLWPFPSSGGGRRNRGRPGIRSPWRARSVWRGRRGRVPP